MANPVVSGLDNVKDQSGKLIKKLVVGSDTIKQIRVQTGVKKTAVIHVVTNEVALQAGGCGWNTSGDTTFSQRDITGALIKVNQKICPDEMRGKYAEYLLRTAEGTQVVPFEEVVTEQLVENIQNAIEKLIWQGNTSGNPADLINGILTIAGADANVITDTHSSGSAYAMLKGVDNKIPEAVYGKAVIFVPPYLYRELIQDLVSANLYHYDPANGENDIFLPGTSTRVHKTQGMAGAKKAFAAYPDHIVYGTDLESDSEQFELFWANEAREFRFAAQWVSGINYAFSDQCVLATDSRA